MTRVCFEPEDPMRRVVIFVSIAEFLAGDYDVTDCSLLYSNYSNGRKFKINSKEKEVWHKAKNGGASGSADSVCAV